MEFDTADFVADGSTESDGPTVSLGTDYAPPSEETQQAPIDPELGPQDLVSPPPEASTLEPTTTQSPSQPEASMESSQTSQRRSEGELSELD